MLLWTNDHTRSHEAHEGDDFVGCKPISINEVSSNEAACPSQACFAVYSNPLLLLNHVVRQSNELLHDRKRRACTIFKDHINVLNTQSCEVRWAVEFRVQSDDQADIFFNEMREHVLEWL